MKDKIKKWFDAGCEYEAGITLFGDFGNSRTLYKNLARSRSAMMHERLKYELCKLAELPESILTESPKAISTLLNSSDERIEFTITPVNGSYPAEVIALIKQRNLIGYKRAKRHNAIVDLGFENTDEVMGKRMELLKEVNTLTSEYDALDLSIKKYAETGVLYQPNLQLLGNDITPPEAGSDEPVNKYLEKCKTLDNLKLQGYLTSTLRSMKSRVTKELKGELEEGKRVNKEQQLKDIEEAISYTEARLKDA